MRIGVLTKDFRVYYRLLNLLKQMNLNFQSLLNINQIDHFDVIFSDEDLGSKNCFVTDGTNEYWIRQMIFTGPAREIVIGIDPGPSPGIAALADGKVLDSRNLYELNQVEKYVRDVKEQCQYEKLRIKIGNGDSVNREKIIRTLLDFDLEIIKEEGSSKSSKRGMDWKSAIEIAESKNIIARRKRKIKN